MFKKNIGNADRAFRIVLGIALISLVFAGPRTIWGWVGIIPLLTAFMGSCPLYSLFGLSTCPKQ
jgi:Protein of unknown function (DUF2892)